jgi:hypothetical protein
MPRDLPPEPDANHASTDDDAYALPAELAEEHPPRRAQTGRSPREPAEEGEGQPPGEEPGLPAGRPKRASSLKLGLAVALVAVLIAVVLGYMRHKRQQALALALPAAEAFLRLDTAAGFRAAADKLVGLDEEFPMEAGAMRAFALAMQAADYRDADAERKVEALQRKPSRAEVVPAYSNLADAAIFLGRRQVADAATYGGRAGRHPWAGTLQGRIAILAGNLEVGVDPAAAAVAADPALAAAAGVLGDLLRRQRKDPVGARAAYAAGLNASPLHPRSTYGLAKLALASQIPLAEAITPLQRLHSDAQSTPANERAVAALFLAAIELRTGDRTAATAALDAAPGLDGPGRIWAERAATVLALDRKAYRAVKEAPPAMQSASDDDPPEASPIPPPPPPPPAPNPAAKAASTKKVAPKKATAIPAKKVAPAPVKKGTSPPAKKPPAK